MDRKGGGLLREGAKRGKGRKEGAGAAETNSGQAAWKGGNDQNDRGKGKRKNVRSYHVLASLSSEKTEGRGEVSKEKTRISLRESDYLVHHGRGDLKESRRRGSMSITA